MNDMPVEDFAQMRIDGHVCVARVRGSLNCIKTVLFGKVSFKSDEDCNA